MTVSDTYDDLHDDDELAFAQLVEQFDAELKTNIENSDERADTRYFYIDYMNKVFAASRALDLVQFSGWSVPGFEDNVYDIQREFSIAVQNFIVQTRIRKSRVQRIYSVALNSEAKEKIHAYIHGNRLSLSLRW